MIKLFILLSFGVASGSVCRYMTAYISEGYLRFRFSAVLMNILGCYVSGTIIGLIDRYFVVSQELRVLFPIGFLIGFLTFSIFSVENIRWVKEGNTSKAFLHSAITVFTGFLSAWGGFETTF